MKRTINIIIGCILVALSYNIFFIPNNIMPNGLLGISALFNKLTNFNPVYLMILINAIFLLLVLTISSGKRTLKYLLPSILIPILILITSKITTLIKIEELETIIVVISGSFIMGLGFSFIYKEGLSFGFDILQDIINYEKKYQTKTFSIIIELLIFVVTILVIDFEMALYSLISIIIIIYMRNKSKIGISNSKTFYIITTKADEIKDYILNELKYDYTEFDVKGGFSHQKQKIIMSVIDTKDYYRLKEGLTLIDPKVFISIIDNYEALNKNLSLSSKIKEN